MLSKVHAYIYIYDLSFIKPSLNIITFIVFEIRKVLQNLYMMIDIICYFDTYIYIYNIPVTTDINVTTHMHRQTDRQNSHTHTYTRIGTAVV